MFRCEADSIFRGLLIKSVNGFEMVIYLYLQLHGADKIVLFDFLTRDAAVVAEEVTRSVIDEVVNKFCRLMSVFFFDSFLFHKFLAQFLKTTIVNGREIGPFHFRV